LLPLLQRVYVYCLRRQCQKACAAAYVTKHYLQRLYPPGIHTHTTHYSSINLSPALFAAKPRRYSEPATRLIFVGTLERLYKGQDLLTEAIALLKKRGHKVHLTFVGDGRCRSDLERMAANLDLASSITFLGKVPAGEGVAAVLDAAELFILPSKSEGLPRAMIEAMARGLPCIGTSIAGIPELLPPEDMVPPGDLRALVQKIEEVITDPGRMTAMAERNLLAAQEYRQEFIESRRRDFYRYIYTNCAPRAAARNSP
jgi:glycosyltransferase involved in cell wall biosynthesis